MKTKGFTLVEILLVILLIGTMATIAVNSYINSTSNFKFLSSYQQVTSALRVARSNALSNELQNGVSTKRYGVCISSTNVTTFADTGDKEFKFDLKDKTKAVGCDDADVFATSTTNEDVKLLDKTFDLGVQEYVIDVIGMELPVLIFYDNGTGNLRAINGKNQIIDKAVSPYLNISVAQKVGSLIRYIKVYQVSGLAEESTTK